MNVRSVYIEIYYVNMLLTEFSLQLHVNQTVKMEGPVKPLDTVSVHLVGEDSCVKNVSSFF